MIKDNVNKSNLQKASEIEKLIFIKGRGQMCLFISEVDKEHVSFIKVAFGRNERIFDCVSL